MSLSVIITLSSSILFTWSFHGRYIIQKFSKTHRKTSINPYTFGYIHRHTHTECIYILKKCLVNPTCVRRYGTK